MSTRLQEPRGLSRDEAAAYCGATLCQFRAMVAECLLPNSIDGTETWDRRALYQSVATMDVRSGRVSADMTYFIEMGEFIKIGFSGSPQVRMKYLQNSTPYDLVLLATIPGGEDVEQKVHALFARLRERGEWFRKSPGLLAYIEWMGGRP